MCVCIKWLQKLQNKNGKNVILKHLFIIAKKKINKLWQKWATLKYNLGIQILLMLYYRESETTAAKKPKALQKKKKKNTKLFLKVKRVFLLLKNLH